LDDYVVKVMPNCEVTRNSEGVMRLDIPRSDRNVDEYQKVVKSLNEKVAKAIPDCEKDIVEVFPNCDRRAMLY
jgi:hypothetical protein